MGEMAPLTVEPAGPPRDLSREDLWQLVCDRDRAENVPVLVFDGHAISVAERCIGRWYALVGDKTPAVGGRSMAVVEPTCWMPLPDPPGGVRPALTSHGRKDQLRGASPR